MRETKFSILKAIAIICVVLSHAGIRGWLFDFIFIFHVPIFFICAGYFFNTKYLTDERTYLVHRIKGLYFPFVRWSLFFLVIHNLLFTLGILSETYGNAEGGVTHPYSWHQFAQNAWSIVANMSGYDQFLCGSFWFFRALLLASAIFLVLFKLLKKSENLQNDKHAAWGMLLISLLLITWKILGGLNMTGVAQGGYRELMGVAFMACGFLIRKYELCNNLSWKVALPSALILLLASFFFPSSMAWNPTFSGFISLPLPAVAAFIAFTYLCGFIDKRDNFLKKSLVHIGNNTLYVFAFHLVAFKVVSAIKVGWYGLPWEAVGGHPTVINPVNNALWVILYVIAGVGLPLLWVFGYRKVAVNVTFSEKQLIQFCVVGSKELCRYIFAAARMSVIIIKNLCISICNGIKAIIDASSPKKE